jgi:imidazole glycerol-phosphate synthase subunit HisF
MLAKRIIPCLDIKDNQVVKGINFINLKNAGDPVELAKKYYNQGADELVFLDITASYEKRKTVAKLAKKVSQNIFIPFTIGGGISSIEDVKEILKAGADKVSINTAAIENPYLIKQISEEFGSQCCVVAIDVKDMQVYSYGGSKPTELNAVDWAKQVEKLGAGEILLTSMNKDGTKSGFDIKLTKSISDAVNIPIIASGGVGTPLDFIEAFKVADAALAASIFHYGEYTINDIKDFCKENGVLIR